MSNVSLHLYEVCDVSNDQIDFFYLHLSDMKIQINIHVISVRSTTKNEIRINSLQHRLEMLSCPRKIQSFSFSFFLHENEIKGNRCLRAISYIHPFVF